MKSQPTLPARLDGIGRRMAELTPEGSRGLFITRPEGDFNLHADALLLATKGLMGTSSKVAQEALTDFDDWSTLPLDGGVAELAIRRTVDNYGRRHIETTFTGGELLTRQAERIRPFMRLALGRDCPGTDKVLDVTVGLGLRRERHPAVEAMTIPVMTGGLIRHDLVGDDFGLLIGSGDALLDRLIIEETPQIPAGK